VLVTGATGFVGRHLVPGLAEHHDVVAVARPGRDLPELGAAVQWLECDLAGGPSRTALPDRVDAIVHLAQSAHYKAFPERADDVFAINVEATFRLLDYARDVGASHFVFASTGGVYGGGDERMDEHAPVSPIDFYLRSKYAAELLIRSYEAVLVPVVFRFFFVYGAGQERMLVPTLARRVLDGDEIVVQGDPGLRINPIHVSDVVEVFEPALARSQPGLFNVAGEETVTLTGLVELLGQAAGVAPRIRHDAGPNASADLVGDNARMREVLGVTPSVRLRDGLRGVVEGLRATA
jgi:nucleoside-diphosphate-sugar epimerase